MAVAVGEMLPRVLAALRAHIGSVTVIKGVLQCVGDWGSLHQQWDSVVDFLEAAQEAMMNPTGSNALLSDEAAVSMCLVQASVPDAF